MEETTWECENMMRATYPSLFKYEGTLFSHLIIKKMMIVAYACDYMYMWV